MVWCLVFCCMVLFYCFAVRGLFGWLYLVGVGWLSDYVIQIVQVACV